jgi:hypothetical protein
MTLRRHFFKSFNNRKSFNVIYFFMIKKNIKNKYKIVIKDKIK